MKTWVIADIHGNYIGFKNVLKKSHFDLDNDHLICLGDTVDGGKETNKCFNLLLKIKNLIVVQGNHDLWALNWMNTGEELPVWVHQGGYATMASYDFNRKNVPDSHKELIRNALPYYIDEHKNCFVHGGFNPKVLIKNQKMDFLVWDRTLIKYAEHNKIPKYNTVFIGHTTTQLYKTDKPLLLHNLLMCDTGGGWNGKISLINVDDIAEYYQSEGQTYWYRYHGDLETYDIKECIEGEDEFEYGVI